MRRRLRLFITLLLAIMAGSASAGAASTSCQNTSGITVSEAALEVWLDPGAKTTSIVLQGLAKLPANADGISSPAAALCLATIGPDLANNSTGTASPFCNYFFLARPDIGEDDTLDSQGELTRFRLARKAEDYKGASILELAKGKSICADRLTVDFRYTRNSDVIIVPGMPQSHNRKGSRFILTAQPRSDDILLQALTHSTAVKVSDSEMTGPRSWNKSARGFGLRWTGIGSVIILYGVIIAGFIWIRRKYPVKHNTLHTENFAWLVVPVGILFFYHLIDFENSITQSLLGFAFGGANGSSSVATALNDALRQVSVPDSNPVDFVRLIAGFAVLAVALVLHAVILLATRGRSATVQILRAQTRIISWSAAAVLALFIFTYGLTFAEAAGDWLGFEGPALLLSLLLAAFAVHQSRRNFSLSRKRALALAVFASITILFPTDPVVRSSGTISIAEHSVHWASFIAFQIAGFLYVAALAYGAYATASHHDDGSAPATRWIMLFLALEVGLFSLGSLPNALAITAVMLVGSSVLFSRALSKDVESVTEPMHAIDFAFLVGIAAASIYLFQSIFSADPDAAAQPFAILRLAQGLRVFAIGLTAGLALVVGRNCLRGDSATLQALGLSVFIVAINIASFLDVLRARQQLVEALSEHIAVMSALVLSAGIYFDLPRHLRQEQEFTWRGMFKGTTLAKVVPIVSTAAAAIASALSPVFVAEVGSAFGQLLKTALPQQSATAAAPPPASQPGPAQLLTPQTPPTQPQPLFSDPP